MRPGSSVLTLRQARYARALTQRELGELAGLTHVQVARIELGQVSPRPATRRALAQALDLDVERIDWPGSALAVGAITDRGALFTKSLKGGPRGQRS